MLIISLSAVHSVKTEPRLKALGKHESFPAGGREKHHSGPFYIARAIMRLKSVLLVVTALLMKFLR